MLISIKLSLPCKNDVTYKSIEPVVVGFTHGCVFVSPAISVPKDKYDMQEKQRCMILFFPIFKAFLISSAGSLLASIKSLKNIYCGKKCNYPQTTTQGDRFASCENIVSRSQTSSLPSLVVHNMNSLQISTDFGFYHAFGRNVIIMLSKYDHSL